MARLAYLNAFALAAIAFGTALFFFALFAFRHKEHFFAECFGDPLAYDTFVTAPQQLFYGFTVTSFYLHKQWA